MDREAEYIEDMFADFYMKYMINDEETGDKRKALVGKATKRGRGRGKAKKVKDEK